MWRQIYLLVIIYAVIHETKGAKRSKAHQRMISGRLAKKEDWKFIAYLNFHQKKPLWKTCGAALINKQFVLTAAHCIRDIYNKPEHVTVGLNRLKRSQEYKAKENFTVSQIYVHPDYKLPHQLKKGETEPFTNDIALLKLSTEAEGIPPISLPDKTDDISSSQSPVCRAAGWGSVKKLANAEEYTKKLYKVSETLQEIDVKLYPKSQCITDDEITPGNYYGDGTLSTLLCGMEKSKTKTTYACVGDSGSPLTCVNPEGKYALYGVVVSGDGLCEAEYQHLYFTEIAKFRDWIDGILD